MTTIALSTFVSFITLLCLIALPVGSLAADKPVLLILGDSLSAGYGIDRERAWPRLLQQKLDKQGHQFRVENASISGETTRGGLARLPRLIKRHAPRIVLIELGANDGLRGLAIDEVKRNLTRMIELLEDADARAVLFEMRVLPNYGPAYAEQFDSLFTALADAHDIALVPFFLDGVVLNRNLMQNDGLHPNAEAQPIMLENVWDTIAHEF